MRRGILRGWAAFAALTLAGCGGFAGHAPDLAIGRVVMVEGPVFSAALKGEAPPALTAGVWGAVPAGAANRSVDENFGAAIQFTARPDGMLLLDIVPARVIVSQGRAGFSAFNGFSTEKGYRPADYAYSPDVPVKLIPAGKGYATEFAYGKIHMIGYLAPSGTADAGFDWHVWLDEQYLARILPAEPGVWWNIRGFFARLFGIESDTAVRYRWEIRYAGPDGKPIGKDIRFTEGGAELAAFVRRHADRMFLKGRAVGLRLLTPAEFRAYKARPNQAPTPEQESARKAAGGGSDTPG